MRHEDFPTFEDSCNSVNEVHLSRAVAGEILRYVNNNFDPNIDANCRYDDFFVNVAKDTKIRPKAASAEGITGKQTSTVYRDAMAAGRGDKRFVKAIFYWFSHICEQFTYAESIRVELKRLKEASLVEKVTAPTAPFLWPTYLSKEFVEEHSENQDGIKSDIWLNPYNHHSIPLSGRDNELEKLDGFINEPKPFLICALVAPSGAGKTRLVSEWMKPYVAGAKHANWDAGIVKSRNVSEWKNWEIKRNTLIVIDYTYDYDEVVKTIIERCRYQDQHKVRLLVIDHIYPEKLFNDITWRLAASSGSEASLLQNQFFYKSSPVELKGEELNSNLLRHIIASVASLGKVEFDKEDKNVRAAAATLYQMGKEAQNPDAVRHPLFAALMGQALRDERDFTNWSRLQLLDYYFASYHRLPWMEENEKISAHGLWVGAYIGVATLRRGVGINTLRSCLNLEKQNISSQQAKRIEQLAKRIVSGKDELLLEPFEPDILGENFLLKFLAQLPGRIDLRDSFVAMLSATNDGQSEEEYISNIFEIFQRLTRNLVNDDQTSNDVQDQWQSLSSFLNPDHFLENSPLRCAISIALVDIVKQLKAKQLHRLASIFLRQISFIDLENETDGFLHARSIFAFINYFEQVAETEMPSNCLKHSLAAAIKACEGHIKYKLNGLMLAAYEGLKLTSSFFLFEMKEDVNATTNIGETALLLACENGHAKVVALLIAEEANIDQCRKDDGATALILASQNNHAEVVTLLVAEEANIDQYTTDIGVTALILASKNGHAEVVAMLIVAQANVDLGITDNGATALVIASQNGHAKVVKLLIAARADVNLGTDDNGFTALALASQNGHAKVVKLLIDTPGIDIQRTDVFGLTALMLATRYSKEKTVDLLNAHLALHKKSSSTNDILLPLNGHFPNGWTPIFGGDWHNWSRIDKGIWRVLQQSDYCTVIERGRLIAVRHAKPLFYPDTTVIEVLLSSNEFNGLQSSEYHSREHLKAALFVINSSQVQYLNGQSWPIKYLNAQSILKLNEETVISYLQFYGRSLVAENSVFNIISKLDTLSFYEQIDMMQIEGIKNVVHDGKITQLENGFTVSTTVQHSDVLSRVEFSINLNGQIKIAQNISLTEPLPLVVQTFEDGMRHFIKAIPDSG